MDLAEGGVDRQASFKGRGGRSAKIFSLFWSSPLMWEALLVQFHLLQDFGYEKLILKTGWSLSVSGLFL